MITVTIPPQKFDRHKYMGVCGRCYLEDALDQAGYPDAIVFAVGRTRINGINYVTKEEFGSSIVRDAFERGESLTVTLTPTHR